MLSKLICSCTTWRAQQLAPLSLHRAPACPSRVQGLFGCLPWGMILTYFNDFLSQNKGLSVQAATLVRHNTTQHYTVCIMPCLLLLSSATDLPLTLITVHVCLFVLLGADHAGSGPRGSCGGGGRRLAGPGFIQSAQVEHERIYWCGHWTPCSCWGGQLGTCSCVCRLINPPCCCCAGGCTVAGVLPMYFLINADVASLVPLSVFMAFLAGALSGTVGPNMRCAGAGLGCSLPNIMLLAPTPWPTSAASCRPAACIQCRI